MAAGSRIKPSMEGRNARLIVVQDRVPKSYPWKTWSIKPIVVKHADDVNGEQRPRLSVTLSHYEITAQMYVLDAEWLRDWLAAQAARDAMSAPLEQQGAVRFNPNDLTRKSFILDELILDDWDFSQGGRTEKQMVTVNMRCTDLLEAKAA